MIDGVLLTGAGSGIGQAIALRLATRGVSTILAGRPASTEVTRRKIHELGGRAELYPCDLDQPASIQGDLAAIIGVQPARRWGVILAASMLDPAGVNSTATEYERVFRTNVIGNLAVLNACLPAMRKANFGRVIFFAGGGAAYAYPIFPAYALSKVSTVRLVENLAEDHPPSTGLSFVCLAPGAVDTPMLARVQAAGGEVKTKTAIEEPVNFAETYCASTSTALSGRYVHVRDNWKAILDGSLALTRDQFYLRRIQ